MDTATLEDELVDLPTMLTITEAGVVLRIGRTTAYRLAARFLNGDPTGLPVARIADRLRVPRWALCEYVRSGRVDHDVQSRVDADLDAQFTEAADPARSRSRRASGRGVQLQLLASGG